MASAQGSLRQLLRNPELRGLVGGVNKQVVGVTESAEKCCGSCFGAQKRAGAPMFDAVVELRRGTQDEWRVVLDVATAVDAILQGKSFTVQRRTRDPGTDYMQMDTEKV